MVTATIDDPDFGPLGPWEVAQGQCSAQTVPGTVHCSSGAEGQGARGALCRLGAMIPFTEQTLVWLGASVTDMWRGLIRWWLLH